MVNGFNTNVEYRGKVFHVQTEACDRRSLIRTVVFDQGKVVASHDAPYEAPTLPAARRDRERSRQIEKHHRNFVRRLREFGLPRERKAPVPSPVADPAVQEELDKLDRRIDRLLELRGRIVNNEDDLDEEPSRVVVETERKRRRGIPWIVLGLFVLLAAGWGVRSWLDRAEPPKPATIRQSRPTEIVHAPVAPVAPVAPKAAPAAPASSERPNDLPAEPGEVVIPPQREPVAPAPAEAPATQLDEPRAETLHATLVPSPRAPAKPVLESPELPLQPPPAAPAEDWTGKLVPLADVDAPPWPTARDLPRYTRRAKRRNDQGRVELNLLVDESGQVAQIELLQEIPDSDLNQATVEVARLWQFRPARKAGYPVRVWKPMIVEFSIVSGTSRVVVVEE